MSIPVSIDPLGTMEEPWVLVPKGMTVQQVTGSSKLPGRIEYVGSTKPTGQYSVIGQNSPEDWPEEIYFKCSLLDFGDMFQFGPCYSEVVHFIFPNGFNHPSFASASGVFSKAREIYVDCGGNYIGSLVVNISEGNLRKVCIKLSGQQLARFTWRYVRFSAEKPLEKFVLIAPNLKICDLGWLGATEQSKVGLLQGLHQLPIRHDADGVLWLQPSSPSYAVVDVWLTELGIAHSYTENNPPVIADGEPLPNGWSINYRT